MQGAESAYPVSWRLGVVWATAEGLAPIGPCLGATAAVGVFEPGPAVSPGSLSATQSGPGRGDCDTGILDSGALWQVTGLEVIAGSVLDKLSLGAPGQQGGVWNRL